jgi:hypothetical protein
MTRGYKRARVFINKWKQQQEKEEEKEAIKRESLT